MQPKILQGEFEKRMGIFYEYDPYSRPLGEGGMGVVYKGFRVNSSNGTRQVVAIKAMKDGLPEEVYVRAKREADIQLRNDNLVEMYGFITTTEQELGGRAIQRYYVVSEFLNGIVLTDLLKGKFKDTDGIEIPFAKQLYLSYISDRENTVLQIIKSVLSGIMALHDKGYIHRDIDPSNVMVTKDGKLKIIDFGIAKDIRNLNTKQDSLRTSTGKFIGKAEYAAPELVLGDVKSQDYTTDIYAIGVLLYQLFVGKLPFEGPQYDVLQKQLKSKMPVRKVQYAKYRSVIRKATEKDQKARYQSCYEMRNALDAAGRTRYIDWRLMGKIAASIVFPVMIGFGAYIFINKTPDYVTTSGPDYPQQFDNAMALLNSENKDSIIKGWKDLTVLAQKDYAAAKREVGLTYFSDSKVEISPDISRRRNRIGIKENVSESKRMLLSIQNDSIMTGESLAALGLYYFRDSEFKEARTLFKKALLMLDKDNPLYKEVQERYKQISED